MQGYSGWGFRPYYTLDCRDRESYPFIAALRPVDGECTVEWYDPLKEEIEHVAIITNDSGDELEVVLTSHQQSLPLENNKLYTLEIRDCLNPARRSEQRRVLTAPVIGQPVNYLHPDDPCYLFSGHSLCSPSIVKLPSGSLLVSMDIYRNLGGQNLTKIFRSNDGGKTWEYQSDLFPCFWGKLFWHSGELYMLAMTTEYGCILIGKSADEGKTWSDFVTLFSGSGNRYQGGPHKAPLNIMEYGGRLWTAIDFGTWEKAGHANGILSIGMEENLLEPSNWKLSGFLPFDNSWEGAAEGVGKGCLEGNMIVLPDGKLYNLLRYQIQMCTPTHDKAVLLSVNTEKPEQTPEFYKVIDFFGGLSKFSVQKDEKSGYYISLVNRVVNPEKPLSRDVLSLVKSPDAIHWEFVRDVLDLSAYLDSAAKIGVQYPDLIIDGEDLLWVQRTAMNNALNFHDSNYITFHRMKSFRKYLT